MDIHGFLQKNLIKERRRPDPLADEVAEVCARLRAADAAFAETTDSDLLDAAMYERLALQAHYRYLTRQLRERAARRTRVAAARAAKRQTREVARV